MDVEYLKSMGQGLEQIGVRILKKKEMTLAVDNSHVNNVARGVNKALASKYMEYEPSLNGVLLAKENIRNVNIKSEMEDRFHVSLKADFYVFAPAEGNNLNVKVMRVKENSAAAEALNFFKVQITKLPSDHQLKTGQTVTIKITAVAYSRLVPHIYGEFVSMPSSQVNGDRERDDLNNEVDDLDEEIEAVCKSVEIKWMITKSGDLTKGNNNWLKSDLLDKFPREPLSPLYFCDEKSI